MLRPEAELDIECFSNWYLVGITDRVNNIEWDFQLTKDHPLDIEGIKTLLRHYTMITFNGVGYDWPILMLALMGADNAALKAANDEIIVKRVPWWEFYNRYNCWPDRAYDHIDVSEVAPGVKISLKQYACRMASETVQDTPVDFNSPLPMSHVVDEIMYCRNDRRVTGQLRDAVDERIKLRARVSERFGVDLRSKSDAQMAEAIVKAEWQRKMADSFQRFIDDQAAGRVDYIPVEPYWHLHAENAWCNRKGVWQVTIPKFAHGTTFKAKIPHYVHFATRPMCEFLDLVRGCDFFISSKDEAEILGLDLKGIKTGVLIPPELKGRDIVIGSTVYRVGIGGLHSQESSVSYVSHPLDYTMVTADVGSYYPTMIINSGMFPPQLGPVFGDIFRTIYKDRMEAKATLKTLSPELQQYAEIKAVEGGFKIVLNGTFGKLFSRYSIFYAPELGIAVTIGGQLSLLMLIERLELSGIRVVSANTDGIECAVPNGRMWLLHSIFDWWQAITKLTLDTEPYLALHARDVNNYLRFGFDGSVKRKGVFGASGIIENKHPDADICAEAVIAYIKDKTPIMQTLMACQDVRKFVRTRSAKGSAMLFREGVDSYQINIEYEEGTGKAKEVKVGVNGGIYLGRAARWYYATGTNDYIIDAKSFNKVAGSDQCRTVMQMPNALPHDIDYGWYANRSLELLKEIGL